MTTINKYVDAEMSGAPMTRQLKHAVQQALAAQGGMIYSSKELPVQRFLEKPKLRQKFHYVRNGKPMSFQAIWREKNRNGFKRLSVMEYTNTLALMEQDEMEPSVSRET